MMTFQELKRWMGLKGTICPSLTSGVEVPVEVIDCGVYPKTSELWCRVSPLNAPGDQWLPRKLLVFPDHEEALTR
jgi:hypothetical protein